jgi:hypothetical protein
MYLNTDPITEIPWRPPGMMNYREALFPERLGVNRNFIDREET